MLKFSVAALAAVVSGNEYSCTDSTTWHKKGDTNKDCAWVLAKVDTRCNVKGSDKSRASYSCPEACNTGCADSAAWHKKDASWKTCEWVARKPSPRCAVKSSSGERASSACDSACAGSHQAAALSTYPGYVGDYAVIGVATVAEVRGNTDTIAVSGTLSGLEPSATGGLHVHSGYSCDDDADVGGHYYEGMDSDPWTTMYTSDSTGVASFSFSLDDFTIHDAFPVAGRAVVVHLSDGTRAGCGLLTKAAVATFGSYPDYADRETAVMAAYPEYAGGMTVTGALDVTNLHADDEGLTITGTLSGLEASVEGGLHIHEGTSCDAAADVGGHYYEGMGSDPWTTTYMSDANGMATVDFTIADFTLHEDYPVSGRTVVIHAEDGTRIACGLLSTIGGTVMVAPAPTKEHAELAAYPDYAGTMAVSGTVVVVETETGLALSGALSGLEASVTGGLHIHEGTSCKKSDKVGGHYYEGMDSDPWTTTTYTTDKDGMATVDIAIADFTMFGMYPVSGRAVVIHAEDGTRVACGLLSAAGGISMVGVLTGLGFGATGGFHVHEGTTCAVADDIGGHYYEGMGSDPWTTTMITSDDHGVGESTIAMNDFTLDASYPVAGRAVVIHAADGTRVGCGVLSGV